ncbi:MAG: hypothetical protein L0Y71_09195 [Gemmataceae bacterium]|nr:hypothetical protein [Gemmataceae bacterium]
MTSEQLNTACRAFCRRRPFRTFLIEFNSGNQMAVSHPDGVRNEAHLFVARLPDGGHVVFAADGVSRLLDASRLK